MYTPMYYLMGIGQVVNCRKQPALHAMQLNSQPGSILLPVSMGSPAFFFSFMEFASSELSAISNQIPIHIITAWHCISGCTSSTLSLQLPTPPFQEERSKFTISAGKSTSFATNCRPGWEEHPLPPCSPPVWAAELQHITPLPTCAAQPILN